MNEKLTNKIMELHEEVKLTRGIPQVLCESVATCRDTYKDVLTVMQVSGDQNAQHLQIYT